MKISKFIIILFIFSPWVKAQDTLAHQYSIQKPSILSAHTFGIFSGRLEGHFKSQPAENISFQFDYLSANVLAQPVENYIPVEGELIDRASSLVWHGREFLFDRSNEAFQSDPENFKIAYDVVIKGLKAKIYVPVNSKNALQIELRSFLLNNGDFPFTGITGDDFIGAVHSNVAGGEDPFQLKDFTLNAAEIDYTDRNGRHMLI